MGILLPKLGNLGNVCIKSWGYSRAGELDKYLETNEKRSAAAAYYSSRFSSSVLSRALKEL